MVVFCIATLPVIESAFKELSIGCHIIIWVIFVHILEIDGTPQKRGSIEISSQSNYRDLRPKYRTTTAVKRRP